MRRVRRVGLALVDERRRLVGGLGTGVRRPGEDHEVGGEPGRTAGRSSPAGRRRCPHPVVAALVDQVEAVVEELSEQREPRVVRRGQAGVGGRVGNEERAGWRDLGVRSGGLDGGRVGRRLVDDQVADPSRRRIDDCRSGRDGRVVRLRLEQCRDETREELVGCAELRLVEADVRRPCSRLLQVPSTVRRPNGSVDADLVVRDLGERIVTEYAVAQVRRPVADRMLLSDPDLLEDEIEVGLVEVEPLSDRCLRGDTGYRAGRCRDQSREQAERNREHARVSSPPGARLTACQLSLPPEPLHVVTPLVGHVDAHRLPRIFRQPLRNLWESWQDQSRPPARDSTSSASRGLRGFRSPADGAQPGARRGRVRWRAR